MVSAYFNQHVIFRGGALDGQSASAVFIRGRFMVGMEVKLDDCLYVVRGGPIARAVEESQDGIPHAVIVLVPKDKAAGL